MVIASMTRILSVSRSPVPARYFTASVACRPPKNHFFSSSYRKHLYYGVDSKGFIYLKLTID